MSSPFLDIPSSEWVASNELAFAIRDRFPVSPGHTLVIPRRLLPTYFDATPEEKTALWALVDQVKAALDTELHPDGYNVGFNAGEASGQTVMHLHLHVIPRFRGDVDDPRGGVRHIIPEKGNYLREANRALATGGTTDQFGRHLRPLFSSATDIAIVAAFVTEGGLDILRRPMFGALESGAHIRLVTGDYLAFTQVSALRRLLAWSQLQDDERPEGTLEVRVVETNLPGGVERAFHPKSWRFEGLGFGVAFVGSSNMSRSALETGIEWNLRVERAVDPAAYGAVATAFEGLWSSAIILTADWIDAYEERARLEPRPLPPGETEAEALEPPPVPREIQEEALAALAAARAQGRRRALVVLATGLGKTWLAAFDLQRFWRATGTWPRVLFLAHRQELLAQAAGTFRRIAAASGQPAAIGYCVGELMQPDAPIVVGSVQKLSRAENLERIAKSGFDYVVVDEVHHADAPSYRRILDRLDPTFLLGLTATPDRADEGDILGLFDDFIAYRVDLGKGIELKQLVPFTYFGVRDDIDYAQIPWRNRRFDPAALAAAVQTQRRMERLWQAWSEHSGSRTLVFCCSIEHARFARAWLADRGVRVEAVHAGPGSGDRQHCLDRLARGELEALCVVDMFNEGVDVPSVDRVVMLRPTESLTVFLQQLGRGLRLSEGKEALLVIDFVGNHRLFLDRVRRLLSLVARPTPLRAFLESEDQPALPPGCAVEIDLEAKDLLRTLLPRGALEVERVYRELVATRGTRPTAGELYRLGYRPETLRRLHGGWFRFVRQEGDLNEEETRALEGAGDWLADLETSAMTKSFKMVVLEVLLEADALASGMPLDELARRSHAFMKRSPELLQDLEGVVELPDPLSPPPDTWLSYWRKNPIAAWTRDGGWFALEGDRFVSRLPIAPESETGFAALTRELVDYQLAHYRRRKASAPTQSAFVCTVLSNQRDPILKLPSRARMPDLPTGELDVRLPDGALWRFRLMKEYCNVARPAASQHNQLPDLMRRWFGPSAGHPGTRFEVRFSASPDGWWIEPVGKVLALPTRGRIRSFPSLRAAAGVADGVRPDEPEPSEVTLPVDGDTEGLFAVRAAGDSMNGGKTPIADGDWLVMRWARGAGLGAVAGRVALVKSPDEHGGYAYQLKRVVQDQGVWWLRSDNPEGPSFPAKEGATPIALLGSHVSPESMAPPVGHILATDGVGEAFGLGTIVSQERGRFEGHLFLFVRDKGKFTEPDRLEMVISDRMPGETAFVLARAGEGEPWRYCGVGRWIEAEEQWALPALDFATWRALGKGRDCSRRLPPGAVEQAERVLDELTTRLPQWRERNGKRCRIVERTPGGVRIDGGPGGFAARQVSVTDLAWVLVAANETRTAGGMLDEARVNRARYLEGTPKESTRWIDTGWAIVLADGKVGDSTD